MLAPGTSGEPRIVASSITSYADLHAALRARAEELRVTRSSLDEVSGLQAGYVSKLLAPTQIRRLGPMSLGPMLQVLGMSLCLVEDASAATFLKRLEPRRNSACARMRSLKRPTIASVFRQ